MTQHQKNQLAYTSSCAPFWQSRQQVSHVTSWYYAGKPQIINSHLFQPYHYIESHDSLICFVSVCFGEVLLGNFGCNFQRKTRGERGELRGRAWVVEQKWNQHPTYRGKDTQTRKLAAVNSSSWNSTMRQLWVPAEPDSPTHWASHRQTHTHALAHGQKYHTLETSHALCCW